MDVYIDARANSSGTLLSRLLVKLTSGGGRETWSETGIDRVVDGMFGATEEEKKELRDVLAQGKERAIAIAGGDWELLGLIDEWFGKEEDAVDDKGEEVDLSLDLWDDDEEVKLELEDDHKKIKRNKNSLSTVGRNVSVGDAVVKTLATFDAHVAAFAEEPEMLLKLSDSLDLGDKAVLADILFREEEYQVEGLVFKLREQEVGIRNGKGA